jgi:hypothetical protein
MAEPSRLDPVEHPSNFVRTTASEVSHREELSWLEKILLEMWSATLRRAPQDGCDRGYGDLIHLSRPFFQGFQATLDQPSLENERTLSTNVQERAEFWYEVGMAHCRDQDVWPCVTHYEEAIKVYSLAGNIRGLAKVLVGKIESNLPLTAVRVGTLIDPQPRYFSDTAFSPVLPCARL